MKRKQPLLTIELIPEPAWGRNVRTLLGQAVWDRVRRKAYLRANHRCEICGAKSSAEEPIECHEVWEYDDRRHVQKLVRLMVLCNKCHMVKHIGRAQAMSNFNEAVEWLCWVNDWSYKRARRHIAEAVRKNDERSRWYFWQTDLTLLDKYVPSMRDLVKKLEGE